MSTLAATWMLILGALLEFSAGGDPIEVQVPIGASRDIDVAELVARLSDATGLAVARPSGELRLPIVGLAGGLTRTMLTDSLGPDASLSIRPEALVVTLDPRLRQAESCPGGKGASRTSPHAPRTRSGGARIMGCTPSSRIGRTIPARPTILLVHGLNSTSRVFKHLIGTLEGAGFGLVVYDFPYNRRLEDSCAVPGRLGGVPATGGGVPPLGDRRPLDGIVARPLLRRARARLCGRRLHADHDRPPERGLGAVEGPHRHGVPQGDARPSGAGRRPRRSGTWETAWERRPST